MSDYEDLDDGVRLKDLTRQSAVSELIDRETEQARTEAADAIRERDAYREAAIDRELDLRAREAAEADIMGEADKRSAPRRLRSV